MTASYILRRLVIFFIVVWVAATLNFLVLRLSPGDPVAAMLTRMSQQGASVVGSSEIIDRYRETFGLDQPLIGQYLSYLGALARLDLGVSLSQFPSPVSSIIARALPWTVALLVVATLISFVFGNLLGALLAWRRAPGWTRALGVPMMVLGAIPYYLLAILLLFVFAFTLGWFPAGGSSTVGASTEFTVGRLGDIVYHSVLPALSIVLSAIGGWMLGMRAMMVGVLENDYLTLAEAKGLSPRRIFLWYAMRNAILPQVTGLAIYLGSVVSGAVLVEVIFSYPGVGFLLFQAIQNADFTLIQGITFILVLAVGLGILILDIVYPILDPRISYQQR
jgi:peptide/nickel transport system permease protein